MNSNKKSNVIDNINSESILKNDSQSTSRKNDKTLLEFLEKLLDSNNDYMNDQQLINESYSLLQLYAVQTYRHKYAVISSYLIKLSNTEVAKIDEIANYIERLYTLIQDEKNETSQKFSEEQKDEICKKLLKLLDHISLELIRRKDIAKFKDMTSNANQQVNNLNSKSKQIRKELQSSKKEYITILGIFASIILAFVAGLSFTNSVLSNIHHTSIYRLLFIVCILALFIINILHGLYSFVKKIHFEEEWQNKDNKVLGFINLILFGLMFCIFLLWLFKEPLLKSISKLTTHFI